MESLSIVASTEPADPADAPIPLPASAEPPQKKARIHHAVRTPEEWVEWTTVHCGAKASYTTNGANGQPKEGHLWCTTCKQWLISKGSTLQDHVLGTRGRGQQAGTRSVSNHSTLPL